MAKKKVISVNLSNSSMILIDKICKKTSLSRSQFIDLLIKDFDVELYIKYRAKDAASKLYFYKGLLDDLRSQKKK